MPAVVTRCVRETQKQVSTRLKDCMRNIKKMKSAKVEQNWQISHQTLFENTCHNMTTN